jgi:hypothetical protein
MNILNIESLIKLNKNNSNNPLFPEILKKCHGQIERYAKNHKVTECLFVVPAHIFGKPLYDVADLIEYLMTELSNNGLFVQQRECNIYISWAPDNINYDNYVITRDSHKKEAGGSFMVCNHEKLNNAQRVQQERDKYFKSLCSTNDGTFMPSRTSRTSGRPTSGMPSSGMPKRG